MAGSDPQRLVFPDIGGDEVVMILVDSTTDQSFAGFAAEGMPAIEPFVLAD